MPNENLGQADLNANFVNKAFRTELKTFEKDVKASFDDMAKHAQGAFGKSLFSNSVTGANALNTSLKPIYDQVKSIVLEAEKLGGAFSKGGGGAPRVKKEIDPLTASITALKNETASYRNVVEATDVSNSDAVQNFKRLQTSALGLADGLDVASKQYRDVTQTAAQAARSIKTLQGEQTRLGFSGNTIVGINRSLLGQLGNFGPLGNTAAAGFETFGGAMVGIPTLAGGVATGVLGIGIATAALVKQGIPELQEYQRAMNILSASGETDLGRFKGELEALQLVGGRAAESFSRSELAGALAETVKAGTSADDAMRLLRTSTQLASAESQDLGDSTALVLQNLRQFGLGVEDAARAGDALASAGNLAAGSTADLSTGLATVGPVAKAANLSLEDTLGLLVNLDNKGLSAAETGATGLRSVLAALADPSKEAAGVLGQLNIELENTDGTARSAKDVLFDLKDALAGNEEAMSSAAKIFDSQGITTILALDDSTEQYTETIENSQGALSAYAAEMANGLAPAQDRANAAMADLASTAAEMFAPALEASADGLNRLLTDIDNFVTGGAAGVSTILGIAKAIGDSADGASLLGAAEALEKKLSGDAREQVQGLIADLKEGKTPIEDIAAALQELSQAAALEPVTREIADTTAKVAELEAMLEKAEGQSPFLNALTVGSPDELRQALDDAKERLRQAEAQAQYLREQFGLITGTAGEVEQAFADVQAQVADTVNELNFGGYLNDMFIRLSVEDPEKLQQEVQALVSQTEIELKAAPSPELETALARYQELLEVVLQLTAAQEQAAAAPPPAPDPAPFDAATASINALNEERARLEEEFGNAPGGSELQRSLGEQIAALDETIAGYNSLTQASSSADSAASDTATVYTDLTGALTEATDSLITYNTEVKNIETPDVTATTDYLEQAQNLRTLIQATRDQADAVGVTSGELSEQAAAAEAAAEAQDIWGRSVQGVTTNLLQTGDVTAEVAGEVDILTEATVDVADAIALPIPEASALTDALVALPLPEVTATTRDLAAELRGSLPEAYRAALAENEAFNGGLTTAEVKAGVARQKLQELKDQGVLPTNEAYKKLVAELKLYEGQIDQANAATEQAAEKAQVLTSVVSSLVSELGEVAGGLTGTSESLGIFTGAATDAIGALVSGDFVGFFSSILNGIVGMFTYYAEEMEQYSAAAVQYGEDIAYQFVELDATGREVFDEEAFEGYLQGLKRISERVEALNEELAEIDDSFNTVQNAEVGAREDALSAKLDSQGGQYTFADILEEQTLAIGRAAQERDDAYEEAAALDAAGQHELADRMRDAADSSYNSAVTTINQNAANQAAEIGAATQTNLDAIAANSGASGEAWTQYWNDDTNAQLAAKKNAQIQERRFMQVLNSERYAELLKAGYTEEEAWRIASAELGYTIDETSGDLIASTDAAAQQQSAAVTNSTATTISALGTATGLLQSAFFSQGTTLNSAAVGSGVMLDQGLQSLFGNTTTTLYAQGGALTSTIGSIFGGVAGAFLQGGADAANANMSATNTLLNVLGTNANLTNQRLIAAGTANTKQIVSVANAIKGTDLKGANAIIAQKRNNANAQAAAEKSYADFVGKAMVSAADFKNLQTVLAAQSQIQTTAAAYNAVIGVIAKGNANVASATAGVYKQVIASGALNLKAATKVAKNNGVGGIKGIYADTVGNVNMDDINKFLGVDTGGGAKGGGSGGSGGSGSGSKGGSSGSKGGSGSKGSSGGKKDGLSYSGGTSDQYPEGSPGWYEAKMREIDEQIKKTSLASKIKELQGKKAALQKQLDTLLGNAGSGNQAAVKGSIDYLNEQLQDAQDDFNSATTDSARAAAAERIRILKAELKEKQKLLEDASDGINKAVESQIISIESPIANLDGIITQLSQSVSNLPTFTASSSAASEFAAPLPTTQTPTAVSSYQEQVKMDMPLFNKIVNEFGSHVRLFGQYVRQSGGGSAIPSKAKGQGVSLFTFG